MIAGRAALGKGYARPRRANGWPALARRAGQPPGPDSVVDCGSTGLVQDEQVALLDRRDLAVGGDQRAGVLVHLAAAAAGLGRFTVWLSSVGVVRAVRLPRGAAEVVALAKAAVAGTSGTGAPAFVVAVTLAQLTVSV